LYPTERKIITSVLDFRKYNDEGFFITKDKYYGEYNPLGDISIIISPAKRLARYHIQGDNYDTQGLNYIRILVTENIDSNELLEILVNEAKTLGADALVELSIKSQYQEKIVDGKSNIEILYHDLSGLAIKRK